MGYEDSKYQISPKIFGIFENLAISDFTFIVLNITDKFLNEQGILGHIQRGKILKSREKTGSTGQEKKIKMQKLSMNLSYKAVYEESWNLFFNEISKGQAEPNLCSHIFLVWFLIFRSGSIYI